MAKEKAKVKKADVVARAVELGLGSTSYLTQKKRTDEVLIMIAQKEKEMLMEEMEEIKSASTDEIKIDEDKETSNDEQPEKEAETFIDEDPTPEVEKPDVAENSGRDPRCVSCKYASAYGQGVCRSCTLYKK